MPAHPKGPNEPPEQAAGLRILGAVEDVFAATGEEGPPSEPPVARAVIDLTEAAVKRPERDPGRVGDGMGPSPATAQPEPLDEHALIDPDPARRRAAMEGAATSPWGLSLRHIDRALRDPDDAVRAAAVGAAASRGPSALPLLIPLASARRWPMAQRAALRALPALITRETAPERHVEALLSAVGTMEPPPYGAERPGFAAIARALGRETVAAWLSGPREVRLGAVRLILAEGGPEWLRQLAALNEDPLLEIREAATAAGPTPTTEGPTVVETLEGENGGPTGASDDAAVMSALAGGLVDPDEVVRQRAGAALARIGGDIVGRWAGSVLERGTAEDAVRAAATVEWLGLTGSARALLDRACVTPAEVRGPYLGALSALALTPADLSALAAECDPADRQDAVRIVWRVAGRAALPWLRTFMDDSGGAVRLAVLEVFHDAGDPEAEELAGRALAGDSSVAVRAMAVRVHAEADLEARLGALELALSDPDPDVRVTAVETLAGTVGSRGSALLLRAVREPDERVWRAAMRQLVSGPAQGELWTALRESGAAKRDEMIRWIERAAPDRLAAFAQAHAGSDDREDRIIAVELAARSGDRPSARMVVEALEDPDPRVRRAAAAAMSALRSPGAVPALARALRDPSTQVRVEAVRALGLIDDDAVPATLVAALKDPEAGVGELAGEALARLRSPGVARLLAEALSSPDLRRPAGALLERMGQPAVPALAEIVAREDPDARGAAGALLGRIAGADSFAPGLSSLDPDQRMRSAEVLGAIGGTTATEHLMTALSDPEQDVRIRVISLLGSLGDPRAIEPLRRTLRTDPVHEAAAAAAEALRRLGALPPGEEERQEP